MSLVYFYIGPSPYYFVVFLPIIYTYHLIDDDFIFSYFSMQYVLYIHFGLGGLRAPTVVAVSSIAGHCFH